MSFGKFGQGEDLDEWSQKIHDIMDEMVKRDFVRYRGSGTWQPAINVYETRHAYHLCVELAGVSQEQIEVECIDRQRITVRGCRSQPRPESIEGPLSIHAMEVDEGPFWREIDLPESIDVDHVEASYNEGYLWITVPRATTE